MVRKYIGPIEQTVTSRVRQRLETSSAFRKEWERLQPMEEVARSVIRLRMQMGITQGELAASAGVSRRTIARLGAAAIAQASQRFARSPMALAIT